jgi:hypothetical protein
VWRQNLKKKHSNHPLNVKLLFPSLIYSEFSYPQNLIFVLLGKQFRQEGKNIPPTPKSYMVDTYPEINVK